MPIAGVRLDSPTAHLASGAVTVEARPVGGVLPEVLPVQPVAATVLELNGQRALIDLNGVQLAMASLPGMKPGMEIFVKVAQVAPKLLLEVAPRLAKSPPSLPPLSVGQEIEAEVVDTLPGGTVLVDIQGALLEAEAPTSLAVGRAFSARVEQLQPRVVLQLLTEAGDDAEAHVQTEALRLLRAHIPHQTSSAESLQTLTQELASFAEQPSPETAPPSLIKLQNVIKTLLPEHAPPTAERLAAFIRDGGLHYEAKLLHLAESNPQELSQMAEADLKGALLQTLKDLDAAHAKTETAGQDLANTSPFVREERTRAEALFRETPGAALPTHDMTHDITAALTLHLGHIESQQAVNLLAQAQGEPYQIQIPFFTAQGLTTAFLSIEADGEDGGETGKQKKGKTAKGYNVLFFLDLEGFGQTRTDTRVSEKSLWVAFYVDQSSSVSLLRRELPAFRETLQALGYEEVLLVARPLGQLSPEKRKKFEALTVGVPSSVHLLDVKA